MKNAENRNSIFKPVGAFIRPWWSHMSSRLRKSLCGLVCALVGLVSMQSCGTIKEVPVKTEIIYRDSIKIETRIDTLTVWKTKVEKVRDFTGLEDTLILETSNAKASCWIDTSKVLLVGEIEDKDVPVQVAVPTKEEYHQKDSIKTQEILVPYEVEKEVKVIPKFWRVFGILGIVLTCFSIFQLYLKIKKKFPL